MTQNSCPFLSFDGFFCLMFDFSCELHVLCRTLDPLEFSGLDECVTPGAKYPLTLVTIDLQHDDLVISGKGGPPK